MITKEMFVKRIDSMTEDERNTLYEITGSSGHSTEQLAESLFKWDWNTEVARDMMCKLYAFKD